MNYLDRSALIKRFVVERGSESVHALVSRGEPVATAKIAYAEIYAGLTRKRREGNLADREYRLACRQFERDWRGYIRVDLRDETLLLARDLTRRHPLRGFDAIHLATAISLGKAVGEAIAFVAADLRLLRATRSKKLAAVNAEE